MFDALSHLAQWHSTPDQEHTPTQQPPPQAGLVTRLTGLARRSHARDTTTSLDIHDALDLDIETRKTILCHRLRNATTQAEWHYAAAELDDLEGNNDWKFELECSEYNYTLLQSRLDQLDDARISGNVERMLFLIRTSLSRHIGGMGNTRLYRHSYTGTKNLIERYINSALDTIQTFLDTTKLQQDGLDPRYLLEQVLLARQSFGRSALLLSGGGTFGMNHIGVVKCLWENNLLPRVITGASAGSIVGAVLCTKKDSEMDSLLEDFCYGDLEVFTKTGVDDSILQQAARFLKTGALFDVGNLTRVMYNLMGDMTFLEAYNRTRRILNICVSSASVFELPRLLNYITAPNVIIWSAVAASCSVPGVFTAASLLAKDAQTGKAVPWNPSPQRWVDGSIDGDIPTTRIAEMFNVNHFIVSQVNPHVVPFLTQEDGPLPAQTAGSATTVEPGPGWLNSVSHIARTEALHRMHVLTELGVLPNLFTKVSNVLSQRYSGDITIVPQVQYAQMLNVLKNPTTEYMVNAQLFGERATWPQVDRVRNHCAIELALDNAVHELRARIAFPSMTTGAEAKTRLRTMSGGLAHTRLNGQRYSSGTNRRQQVLHATPRKKSASSEMLAFKEAKGRKRPFDLSLNTTMTSNEWERDLSEPMSPGSATSEMSLNDSVDDKVKDLSSTSEELASPDETLQHSFSNASQPPTPSHRMARLGYFGSISPLAQRASPTSLSPQLSRSPKQSRVKIAEEVRPERRPGMISQSHATSSSAVPTVSTYDWSPRSRRSMSTGLRGLAPPGVR